MNTTLFFIYSVTRQHRDWQRRADWLCAEGQRPARPRQAYASPQAQHSQGRHGAVCFILFFYFFWISGKVGLIYISFRLSLSLPLNIYLYILYIYIMHLIIKFSKYPSFLVFRGILFFYIIPWDNRIRKRPMGWFRILNSPMGWFRKLSDPYYQIIM